MPLRPARPSPLPEGSGGGGWGPQMLASSISFWWCGGWSPARLFYDNTTLAGQTQQVNTAYHVTVVPQFSELTVAEINALSP